MSETPQPNPEQTEEESVDLEALKEEEEARIKCILSLNNDEIAFYDRSYETDEYEHIYQFDMNFLNEKYHKVHIDSYKKAFYFREITEEKLIYLRECMFKYKFGCDLVSSEFKKFIESAKLSLCYKRSQKNKLFRDPALNEFEFLIINQIDLTAGAAVDSWAEEMNRLLRPAEAPQDQSGTLLRPAEGPGEINPDHLLRPVEEPPENDQES